MRPFRDPAQLRHGDDVGEDVVERRRLERNQARVAAQPFRRASDDVIRDRADLAQFLGDDQIRLEPFEQFGIQGVEARALVETAPHVTIDLARTRGMRESACRKLGLRAGLGRKIALMRDAGETVPEPERVNDLGRARQQADNPLGGCGPCIVHDQSNIPSNDLAFLRRNCQAWRRSRSQIRLSSSTATK